MPVFDKEGERTLYTQDKGLVRVYVGVDLGLGSDDGHLADSDGNGRVVVKTGEAGSQNFGEYLSRLNQGKKGYFNNLRKLRDQINAELNE